MVGAGLCRWFHLLARFGCIISGCKVDRVCLLRPVSTSAHVSLPRAEAWSAALAGVRCYGDVRFIGRVPVSCRASEREF